MAVIVLYKWSWCLAGLFGLDLTTTGFGLRTRTHTHTHIYIYIYKGEEDVSAYRFSPVLAAFFRIWLVLAFG